MDDFRKYATKHLGMNSLVLDDVIKFTSRLFESLYPRGTPAQCNAVGRVFPSDDGPHHFPRYAG